MGILTVATHDGKFHADEVFAIAVLELVYGKDRLNIVRTRDPEIHEAADICIDVGLVYDDEEGRFDHHQLDFDLHRENGHPYASFGLVWMAYGERLVSDKAIADHYDDTVVSIVDAADCGVNVAGHSMIGIVQAISDFNPPWNAHSPELENASFRSAVNFAMQVISNRLTSIDSAIAGKQVVASADIILDGKVMVMKTYAPWVTTVMGDEKYNEIDLVIYQESNGGKYMVQAVPLNFGAGINRIDFPEEWCGHHNDELAQISGIKDVVFCHRKGFIAGAKSLDAAIEMASAALQ